MARIGDDGRGETRLDVFVRGVVSGALVGAAIVGSTIWERRRRRVATLAAEPVSLEAGPDGLAPVVGGSDVVGSSPEGAAPEA